MAKYPTIKFSTKLHPLNWVNIEGKGKLKLKKKPDSTNPDDFNYTATVILSEKEAEVYRNRFQTFWRENKGPGLTKQRYNLIKPITSIVKDKDGQPVKDEDGEVLREPTGKYALTFKSGTAWPDGSPISIGVLKPNGEPLVGGLKGKIIGEGSTGALHGKLTINDYEGNEGLLLFLTHVQLKKFVEYNDAPDAEDFGSDEIEGLDDDSVDSLENCEVDEEHSKVQV